MNNTQQSVGKGFAILSFASIVVKLLSLLFVPLMIHILGDEVYGIFGATYQIYVFVYLLANSGIPTAVSKYVSELSEQGHDASAVKTFKIARSFLFLIGLFLSIIMALTAGPFSSVISYREAKLAIQCLAPSILFTSMLSAYRGYFQGRRFMSPTAVTQVVEQLVHIIFSVLFAYYLINDSVELGVAGGTLGTTLGAFVALVMIALMYRSYSNKGYAIGKDSIKSTYSFKRLSRRLLKYAIPITIASAIQYGGNLIDAIISKNRLIASGLLANEANISYSFLNRYQQLINVPISIITALCVAILPAISACIAVKNYKGAENRINYSFKLCFIISVPAAFGLSVLSNSIYQMLAFNGGQKVLQLGAFTLILTAAVQIQTAILQSINRLYVAILSLSASVVVKLALNYILIGIPSIRIYGAIISTYVSTLVALLLNFIILKRSDNIYFNLIREIRKPLISSVLMFFSLLVIYLPLINFAPGFFEKYIFNLLFIVVAVVVGVLVYFISLAKLKGINAEIVKSISVKLYQLLPEPFKRMLDY